MRPGSRVWLRRLTSALAVAVTLGYCPYLLYGKSGFARYVRLRAERETLHAANVKLAVENQRLRSEITALSDENNALSRAAVERAARDELGLVKPGEVVYQVVSRP
jgi:cell division protein FtsB